MEVTVSKNFFIGGEMAYLMVNIDNTKCKDPCSLVISHRVKIMPKFSNRKLAQHITCQKQRFFLAGPHESQQKILKFPIASIRKDNLLQASYEHPDDDYNVSNLVPESVNASSFCILHYLQLYLSHKNTLFTNNSTKKFYFQLIQPSLVPGVVDVAPPLFISQDGEVIELGIDLVHAAPEGECIEGIAMDFEDDHK